MLNTFDKPEVSMNYVLVDEGVPLVVGNIVLEIQRKTLAEPEVYLGFETEVRISEQIPAGESTGVDVPGQLWKRYHMERRQSQQTSIQMWKWECPIRKIRLRAFSRILRAVLFEISRIISRETL